MKLGDKIKQAMVLYQLTSGDYIVEVSQIKALLLKKFIPQNTKFNRNQIINDLIVINFNKKGPILAFLNSNYIPKLISKFYSNLYSYEINPIYDRWSNDCGYNFLNKFNVYDYPHQTWINRHIAYIDNHEYVLPIFGSILYRDFNGVTKFYPQKYNETLSQTYKYDQSLLGITLPVKYKAKLYIGSTFFKYINIFLHGFVYPSKWHFDVWKHIYNLQKKGVFNNKCTPNTTNSDCDTNICINSGIFNKVHCSITNDCHNYLKQIVTFFSSTKTNKIGIYKDTVGNLRNIYCCIEGYMDTDVYKYVLVLYGVCWNFHDREPTFHLNPVTFYRKTFKGGYTGTCFREKEDKFGKLEHYGNLGDIRKCQE